MPSYYTITFAGGKTASGAQVENIVRVAEANAIWKILFAKGFQGRTLATNKLAVGMYVYTDATSGASRIISIEYPT